MPYKNAKDIQREQMQGKTKLTTVSFYCNGRRNFAFVKVLHNDNGSPVVHPDTPCRVLNMQIQRGQTFSVG